LVVAAANFSRSNSVGYMTSSKEKWDLVAGYNLGANSYIQKPVGFGQFRKTVKSVGLYWLVTNQPVPLAAGPRVSTIGL
jgi:two-component system, response regulator